MSVDGGYLGIRLANPSVAQFYNEASKTVVDVHEEAKRIAAQKKANSAAATPPPEPATGAEGKAAEAGFSGPAPDAAHVAELAAPGSTATGEKSSAPPS